MPWLMFAAALGAIVVAFNTFSIGLAAVCLLLALGLSIAGTLSLASSRISSTAQSPAQMLDAKALASIRQRAAAAANPAPADEGAADPIEAPQAVSDSDDSPPRPGN